MRHFTLDANHLLAASRIAPDTDVRHYLLGVYVEFYKTGRAIITATNGTSLITINSEYVLSNPHEETFEGSMIIPNAALKMLEKSTTKASRRDYRTRFEWHDGVLKIFGEKSTFEFPLVDGRFPDWRHVVQSALESFAKKGNAPSVIDSRFPAAFASAAKVLGEPADSCRVWGNGENANIVTFDSGQHILGLIMPLRMKEVLPPSPELYQWIKTPAPV